MIAGWRIRNRLGAGLIASTRTPSVVHISAWDTAGVSLAEECFVKHVIISSLPHPSSSVLFRGHYSGQITPSSALPFCGEQTKDIFCQPPALIIGTASSGQGRGQVDVPLLCAVLNGVIGVCGEKHFCLHLNVIRGAYLPFLCANFLCGQHRKGVCGRW